MAELMSGALCLMFDPVRLLFSPHKQTETTTTIATDTAVTSFEFTLALAFQRSPTSLIQRAFRKASMTA